MEFVENDLIAIDEQDTNGSIYFDAKAGRMHSSDVKQNVKMTISANGQTIIQTLNQNATGSFVLKKD